MLAVRVPPSASSTSQSTVMVRSPNAAMSTTARKLRPISRWISVVRPSTRPSRSRLFRGAVLPGSMLYSAVTQPRPVPAIHGGTCALTLAVHRTVVPPAWYSTLPGAVRVNRRRISHGPQGVGLFAVCFACVVMSSSFRRQRSTEDLVQNRPSSVGPISRWFRPR